MKGCSFFLCVYLFVLYYCVIIDAQVLCDATTVQQYNLSSSHYSPCDTSVSIVAFIVVANVSETYTFTINGDHPQQGVLVENVIKATFENITQGGTYVVSVERGGLSPCYFNMSLSLIVPAEVCTRPINASFSLVTNLSSGNNQIPVGQIVTFIFRLLLPYGACENLIANVSTHDGSTGTLSFIFGEIFEWPAGASSSSGIMINSNFNGLDTNNYGYNNSIGVDFGTVVLPRNDLSPDPFISFRVYAKVLSVSPNNSLIIMKPQASFSNGTTQLTVNPTQLNFTVLRPKVILEYYVNPVNSSSFMEGTTVAHTIRVYSSGPSVFDLCVEDVYMRELDNNSISSPLPLGCTNTGVGARLKVCCDGLTAVGISITFTSILTSYALAGSNIASYINTTYSLVHGDVQQSTSAAAIFHIASPTIFITPNALVSFGELVYYQASLILPFGTTEHATLTVTHYALQIVTPTLLYIANGVEVSINASILQPNPNSVQYEFGNITNSPNNRETVHLVVQVISLVPIIATTGEQLQTQAKLSYYNGTSFSEVSSYINVTVVAPELAINVSMDSRGDIVESGTRLYCQATIRHTNTSTATAYDILFSIVLPPQLQLVPGSVASELGLLRGDRDISFTRFSKGNPELIINFQVVINPQVSSDDIIHNNVTLRYYSATPTPQNVNNTKETNIVGQASIKITGPTIYTTTVSSLTSSSINMNIGDIVLFRTIMRTPRANTTSLTLQFTVPDQSLTILNSTIKDMPSNIVSSLNLLPGSSGILSSNVGFSVLAYSFGSLANSPPYLNDNVTIDTFVKVSNGTVNVNEAVVVTEVELLYMTDTQISKKFIHNNTISEPTVTTRVTVINSAKTTNGQITTIQIIIQAQTTDAFQVDVFINPSYSKLINDSVTSSVLNYPKYYNTPGIFLYLTSIGHLKSNSSATITAQLNMTNIPLGTNTVSSFSVARFASCFDPLSNFGKSYSSNIIQNSIAIIGIDECMDPTACFAGVKCIDTKESFICEQCPYGFQGNAIGPTGCTRLCGDGNCTAAFLEDCVTCPIDCGHLASCNACGDGVCDAGETCANCFEDCKRTCVVDNCGSPPCSGNGMCTTEKKCVCNGRYTGPTCSDLTVQVPVEVNETSPSVVLKPQTAFQIAVKSLYESNEGENEQYDHYLLSDMLFEHNVTTVQYGSVWAYNTTLPNNAKIVITIHTFTTSSEYEFANATITIPENSLKINVQMYNWRFRNIKNKIHLVFEATNVGNAIQECNLDNQVDYDNNLLSYTINIGGSSLYGKYLDQAVLDGRNRALSFKQESYTNVKAIIPHFWESFEMDPQFSVLLENKEDSCDPDKNKKQNGVDSKLVGGIIGGILGFVILSAIALFIFRKIQLRLKINKSMATVPSTADGEEMMSIEKTPDMEANTAV